MFCSPASISAPAKLRLLYEVAPLAYVIEAAGGASHDASASALDQEVKSTNQRSVISLGSPIEVEKTIPALQGALASASISALPYGIG